LKISIHPLAKSATAEGIELRSLCDRVWKIYCWSIRKCSLELFVSQQQLTR